MNACIIDDDKILKLKKYAEEHEITREEFMLMYNKQAPLIGDRVDHILYLDVGYRFVYSIENVPHSSKPITYRIRKLSGSVNNGGDAKFPSPIVMEYVADKLGFANFRKCNVKINSNEVIPNIEIHEIIS
uniref:Uncharacterized protein n=1 Tax=viral metagenome TaxID=1070528 RepID=A0A6C0C812_9ZZZZ